MNVGIFGIKLDRFELVTASPRIRPELIWEMTEDVLTNAISICPPITSDIAALAPL